MARTDPLTGLPNRRAFDAALDSAVGLGERFSLLLIDIEQINDTYGHTVGDQVLRAIAACTPASVRSTDTLARIGGDELALVAPGASSDGASRLAGTLHSAVASVSPVEGAPPVTLTISRSTYPEDGLDRDGLLRAADTRLHEVKDMRPPVAVRAALGGFPLLRA
jgi:diguanylate cyclase (GGDEF)-like protein